VQTYSSRDIRDIIAVDSTPKLEAFVRLTAARTGQELNAPSLSVDLGTPVTTIRRWIEALRRGYLIELIPPYSRNAGQRVIRSPKLYSVDAALAMAAARDSAPTGLHLETLVAHDLLVWKDGAPTRGAGTALILFIDELQYVEEEQLGALIPALHRVAQRQLPVMMVGAGLPQFPGRMGRAKSYAERLFSFPLIGELDPASARDAIEVPAAKQGVTFEPAALDQIVLETRGYPYFLQEWGKHVWDVAARSPITSQDVTKASRHAVAGLDESLFRVRFDRLTPAEKRYLRAMAELGEGPHRSGDIAAVLERKVTALGPARSQLISKGMVWSPSHGDTAFTAPMFDQFMKRIMPGDDWRTAA